MTHQTDEQTVIHTYPKGAPAGELPVTVNAPIITDGLTAEGVQPLLDYVASLQGHSNTEVAAKEAERLQPYFSALSVYLTRALSNAEPESAAAKEKETLKGLIQPGRLSAAFNAMADFTRVTLISDFLVMPDDIHKGPAANLFKGAFNPVFQYGGNPFSAGFVELFEGGNKATARSSTTIPVFTLDAKLMKEIAPHQPEELYRGFQTIVTAMNHDMLHHLHSPAITGSVAHKFDGYDYASPINKWSSALVGGGHRIEEWSQISYGKVFMAPGNEALIKETGGNLDRYFDELARIAEALPKEKAHDVVDYFGTVMAQTLSRTFPFNHPIMTQCLDRMQAADPLSEKELAEKAIEKYCKMSRWGAKSGSLKDLREEVAEDNQITNVVKGYRQQGLDIFPDNDKAVSFKGLKLLQLANIEITEMRSHVPTPVGEVEQRVRADSDRAFLDLVTAVAKVTGHKPK